MAGFFKLSNKPFKPITPVSAQQAQTPAYKAASRLAEAVRRAGQMAKPPNLARWAEHFARLLDKHPVDEVFAVLAWYTEHVGDEFVPQCFSAESFRREYNRIRDAQHRTEKDKPVEMTPRGLQILGFIKDGYWPNGSDQDLSAVVQRSENNWMRWYARFMGIPAILQARKDKAVPHSPDWFLADRLLGVHKMLAGELTASFITRWMQGVQHQLEEWPSWNGNLHKFTWTADSDRFKKIGRGLVYEYAHDSRPWDQLVGMIK